MASIGSTFHDNNEMVVAAYQEADEAASEGVERERQRGAGISCSKGCGVCCRYLVRLSTPEVFYLRDCLMALEPTLRARCLERFENARRRLNASDLAAELRIGLSYEKGDPAYDHRVHALSEKYLRLRLACPFLEDEACSIYDWRPARCRQYLVTSPASLCVDPFAKNARRVGMRRDISGELAEQTARAQGGPATFIALPLALEWAAQHENYRTLASLWSKTTLEPTLPRNETSRNPHFL